MRVAICPGSYDPVTKGHVNIIERSAKMFDRLLVVVMVNVSKKSNFTVEERVAMLREVTRGIPNVEVDAHNGLVAEYAKEKGAKVLVKGLRAVTDFEYEFQMALINKKLNPELETVFINSDAQYMFLSSSSAREVAQFGGDLGDFVPTAIQKTILDRLYDPAKTEVPHEH